jgi:hypothetical protein
VIQTSDDSYYLAIQGGLGSLFQFNNGFEFDQTTGDMNVRSDISADIGQLAICQVEIDQGVGAVHLVDDVTAKSDVDWFWSYTIWSWYTLGVGVVVFTYNAVPRAGDLNFNISNKFQ